MMLDGIKTQIEKLCHETGADWGWETMLFEICDELDHSLTSIEKERFLESMKYRMNRRDADE